MGELRRVIDNWSGRDEERRASDQPRSQVPVPLGPRISEMVTLVDDDEPTGSTREPATAYLFVAAKRNWNTYPVRGSPPLRQQGRRHQTCRGSAVHGRSNCERDICLSAAYRVGQQCPAVATDGGKHSPKALLLFR